MNAISIYASYKNPTQGVWVVDGEKGRETYPLRFSKKLAIAAYRDEFRAYECGHYNIVVYKHDIKYSKGFAALVSIARFDDNDKPIDEKHFYLKDGDTLSLTLTEKDIDKIYSKRTGEWLYE